MNIAFFGTGDFSKNILKGILETKKLKISLVVSQPDKIVGRKKELFSTPIKKFCIENNLKILQPKKLKNNLIFFEELRKLNLDFIIVVAYGKIIPLEILNIPKYCCINLHGSILPKYRGASPIQESIKNGDTKTGLTIMQMSEGMDEGDIFDILEIDINKDDTSINIFSKFEKIGANGLINILQKIVNNQIKPYIQNHSLATYCGKISKEDGLINFGKDDIFEIYNKFRAYKIWPGIYCYYDNKKLDIIDCFIINEENLKSNIGDIIKIEYNGKKEIGIIGKGGVLVLKKIKLEGKKETDILSFINGNKNFLNYNFIN